LVGSDPLVVLLPERVEDVVDDVVAGDGASCGTRRVRTGLKKLGKKGGSGSEGGSKREGARKEGGEGEGREEGRKGGREEGRQREMQRCRDAEGQRGREQ
jgi:hypothetical protein